MRKALSIRVAAIGLALVPTMTAAQFDAGVVAYQNERYEEAEALWLKVGPGRDFADAAFNLAILYERGLGRFAYPGADIEWYKRAADAGSIDAQYNLGGLYYRGERVPRNLEDAIYWWAQAGNQGHAEAQYNLGVLLSDGKYVQESPEQALVWLQLSADGGYEPATELMQSIRQRMALQPPPQRRSPSNPGWRDTEELWLFHQDPDDYTLELYRHAEARAVDDFVARHGIAEIARYYLFESRIVVVAGLFNNRDDAMNAIAGFTDDLKLNSLKPVRFAEIHERIRDN